MFVLKMKMFILKLHSEVDAKSKNWNYLQTVFVWNSFAQLTKSLLLYTIGGDRKQSTLVLGIQQV